MEAQLMAHSKKKKKRPTTEKVYYNKHQHQNQSFWERNYEGNPLSERFSVKIRLTKEKKGLHNENYQTVTQKNWKRQKIRTFL